MQHPPVLTAVRRLAALVALLLTAALLQAAPAQAYVTTSFVAQFVCLADGQPMSGVRVQLYSAYDADWPHVPPNVELEGQTNADADGMVQFRVTGPEEDYFMRVGLSSAYAEVNDFGLPYNWFVDTPPNQNDVPLQNYGVQGVPGEQCAVWNSLHAAGADYATATGQRAPQGEVVARYGAITAGVPFANYDTIWWPTGVRDIQRNAKHEFAHTVRHIYDGSETHFWRDVLVHGYARSHDKDSCEVTGLGFAFNEGWADYWAGMKVASGCRDPRIEATVTTGLRWIQTKCGLTRGEMFGVLARNRGRIHSLADFDRAAKGCRLVWLRPVKDVLPPPIPARVEAKRIRTQARAVVARAKGQRASLRDALTVAVADLATPLPCASRPCAEEYTRVARPWLLRARIANVSATIDVYTPLRRTRPSVRLARKPLRKFARAVESRSGAARRLGRTRAAGPLAKAVEAVAAGAASPIRDSALAVLRSLRDGVAAGTPAALGALDPTVGTAVPRTVRSLPDPVLVDPTTGKAVVGSEARLYRDLSDRTYECQGVSAGGIFFPEGESIDMHGTVLPAVAGTQVRVVWRHDTDTGDDSFIIHTVTTDSGGLFTDALTLEEWATGYGRTWSVRAYFDGDLARFGSTSGPCGGRAVYP